MSGRIRRAARSRGPKNNVWTVVLGTDVSVSTTPQEFVVVESADWQGGILGFQHGTLLRVRGWMSTSQINSTATSVLFSSCLYVVDEDEGTNNPQAALTYTDEDVLWTGGVQMTGGGGTDSKAMHVFDVDVKAMRKINSGQEVRMAVVASQSTSTKMSLLLRALIRRGGN